MDTTVTPTTQFNYQSNTKDFIIFVLIIALILSILGINIFIYLGGGIEIIAKFFRSFFASLGYVTGTTINTTTDLATDTAKFGVDVAGGTIHDIGNLILAASDKKAIPDFKQQYNKYTASLLGGVSKAMTANPANIDFSKTPMMAPSPAPIHTVPVPVPVPITVPSPAMSMEKTINTPPPKYMKEVSADNSGSNIQNAPVSRKSNWCLIGEYKDRRGCVEIDDADRCISGQIFPSQQMCLTPNFHT
jgi:hypothetical protein